jgi:flagellar P-ring protein precursor FlgI
VQGVRSNQLTGYGLVVGLDGTGDQTTQMPYTTQAMPTTCSKWASACRRRQRSCSSRTWPPWSSRPSCPPLRSRGRTLTWPCPPWATPSRSRAACSCHAAARCRRRDLCPGPGQRGGGRRRRLGGRQQGADQPPERGPHSQGAQVERSVPTPLHVGDTITLGLNGGLPDRAQGGRRPSTSAWARAPPPRWTGAPCRCGAARTQANAWLSSPSWKSCNCWKPTPAAKVVINARTGSIVLNQAVTLGPCAIAHGNLSITISSTPVISQPNPLSQGRPWWRKKATSPSSRKPGNIIQMPPSPQLADVVRALNSLGATPAGPAGHPAGHQGRRRAERRAGGDLTMPCPTSALSATHQESPWL